MAWQDESNHPFAGIWQKLKRADENIVDLKSEIDVFIESGDYPIVPYVDDKMFQEAIAYNRDRKIPLRFSVLIGEIIHHLRSCLDHIAWHFSDISSRAKAGSIEFPIFEIQPTDKKEIERYARKVKGIANTNVLGLIEDMQPYQVGADVANHAFLIIHNMDIFDKHRELVVVGSSVEVNFPPVKDILTSARLYSQGKLDPSDTLSWARTLKDYKATPGIAFQNFGNWRVYPVVKGLAELLMAVEKAISAFAPEA